MQNEFDTIIAGFLLLGNDVLAVKALKNVITEQQYSLCALPPAIDDYLSSTIDDEVVQYLVQNDTYSVRYYSEEDYEALRNIMLKYKDEIVAALREALARKNANRAGETQTTRGHILGAIARYLCERNTRDLEKYVVHDYELGRGLRIKYSANFIGSIAGRFARVCDDLELRVRVFNRYIRADEVKDIRNEFWFGFVNAKEYVPELFTSNVKG